MKAWMDLAKLGLNNSYIFAEFKATRSKPFWAEDAGSLTEMG